ncbi:hypothetical protein BDR03DRAFT_199137 [Suillus americanus]|nr:hypothetical protein BDR03DRAFT_199137 [Suillus americanus]
MRTSISIGLCWRSVPPAILINQVLSTTLPSAFTTDSCPTWMMPSSSIELHWRSIPLVTLIDPRLSTALPTIFWQWGTLSDLSEAIKLHWHDVPRAIPFDPDLSLPSVFKPSSSNMVCHQTWKRPLAFVIGNSPKYLTRSPVEIFVLQSHGPPPRLRRTA